MHRLVCILFSFQIFINSHAQEIALTLPRRGQVAYIGIDNPLNCVVEKIPCKQISLTPSTGSITSLGNCMYFFRTHTVGEVIFTVWEKKGNQTDSIGTRLIMVKDLPDPITSVGSKSGGKILKAEFIAQAGVGAFASADLGFELRYMVKDFHIIIFRESSLLLPFKGSGNMFTNEMKKSFELLQKNDVIIISEIDVVFADGTVRRVKPMEFIID